MFGAITLIPLYLQIVKGASPTKAGLLTLPLVLGIMAASVIAGQITSRTGRYKIFPVIGCVLLVIGMLLLWRLGADSSLVYADLAMAVVGLGLGMNMQTIVLAMQNAVGPRDIGVATSSTTFFRQMGGTLGVAVFLSILYSVVQDKTDTGLRYRRAATRGVPGGRRDGRRSEGARADQVRPAFNDTSLLNGFAEGPHRAVQGRVQQQHGPGVPRRCGRARRGVRPRLLLKEVPLRTTAAVGPDAPAAPSVDEQAAATTVGATAHVDGGPVDGTLAERPVGPEGGRHEEVADIPVVHVEDLVTASESGAHTAHGTHEASGQPEVPARG